MHFQRQILENGRKNLFKEKRTINYVAQTFVNVIVVTER